MIFYLYLYMFIHLSILQNHGNILLIIKIKDVYYAKIYKLNQLYKNIIILYIYNGRNFSSQLS
jgi:hypothetical protein